jgi:hypothetical protein
VVGQVSAWDFSGSSLTWAVKPCALTTIAVWDLSDGPSPFQGSGCDPVEILSPQLRLSRTTGRFELSIRCSPTSPAGCNAYLCIQSVPRVPALTCFGSSLGLVLHPGETHTLRSTVEPKALRLVRKRQIRLAKISVYWAPGMTRTRTVPLVLSR